jgi:bifunctional DNA-binding transcriptional regulator/antitoxin component of YhaV-PrlF toxin-antitoxin module
METIMDKAGRVELPRDLRDELGLKAGAVFRVKASARGITLKPVSGRTRLVREGNIWVLSGPFACKPEELADLPKRLREERDRMVTGMGS